MTPPAVKEHPILFSPSMMFEALLSDTIDRIVEIESSITELQVLSDQRSIHERVFDSNLKGINFELTQVGVCVAQA